MGRKLRRINDDLTLVIEDERMVGTIEPIAPSMWLFTDINDHYLLGDNIDEGVAELRRVERGEL